jgi:hypothetical protein
MTKQNKILKINIFDKCHIEASNKLIEIEMRGKKEFDQC